MVPEWHVLLSLYPPHLCVLNPQTIFVRSFRCPTGNSLNVGVLSKAKSKQQNSVSRPEPLRGLATRTITGVRRPYVRPICCACKRKKALFRTSELTKLVGLDSFGGKYCLHILFIVGAGSRFVRNVISYLQNYIASLA